MVIKYNDSLDAHKVAALVFFSVSKYNELSINDSKGAI